MVKGHSIDLFMISHVLVGGKLQVLVVS
jgi:hypothetical protein